MVKLEHLSFLLPDLLQPQGQQDLSWRCVCSSKSFPSEPESSEAQARVSSAIQFFFLRDAYTLRL